MKTYLMALTLSLTGNALAYVPTVEALFRHGANPDVSTNALVLSAKVTAAPPPADAGVAVPAGKPLYVKWIYNVTPQGKLKLTQLIYGAAAMGDSDLLAKTFVAELLPQSFSSAQAERGLFLALLNSVLINDGSFLVDFLRHNGVPVKPNAELINNEKYSLLQRYRAWLAHNNGGRKATDESPLAPVQPADKERVARLMAAPMFNDTKQVFLGRHGGEPAWQVKADPFEAWVDDAQREVRQLVFRQAGGDIEVTCREPMVFGGTHRVPRMILVKNALDQYHQVEVLSLRHFNESSTEMLARLRRYDQQLLHKQEPPERPAFLF